MSAAAGTRCLVDDHDAQVRSALVRVIESQRLACAEAVSGAEALALLQTEGEIPIRPPMPGPSPW
jgi:CheY-like chemotaxis protein